MKDERTKVVDALRGTTQRTSYDMLGGLADQMAIDALPTGLGLETGAKRLLDALRHANPGTHRRLLVAAASELGLKLTPDEPKPSRAPERVEAILAEVSKTTERIREWADKMETAGHAVVVRASDPGSKDPAGRCASCAVPGVVGAAVTRADADKREWSIVVVR